MQIESKIRNIKGRTSYLNQRPRRTKSTCASSPFDSAKVVRNTETAKRNLEKLAEKYKGINNVEGFLNDLWLALGLHNQGGNKKGGKPSRYALYQLQDGTKLSISIRASAHNANANKYVEHPPVPDINLSIVLQKKMRKNQFKSNPSVNIGEYVYVNQKIQNVESPLSQIANSLIGFLSNGEYNDTTGVAIVHGNMQTPQEVVNNQTLNCNRNMNKKLIRLTKSDLHRIVKESVRNIMKDYATPPSNEEIAFFKFIHNGNVTPIQCSKAGVDYNLLKKYHYLKRHCYADGHNNPITEDPTPLENEIKKQFITNYRRQQKLGWVKENFTSKRRSVEDFGEPTPELDTTAFKNELTKLVKYLGMAQGNFKGIQSCIKMITQISNELKQHSEDTDFNVKRMLQGLEQATKQLSNGQTQPAVKIVNQIIMEVDRTVNAIKARPNKWNGGIMAESNLHKIVKESVNRILNENPQYERFIESLYDLVGQYYDELGEEIIVDNLKHVAQWVEEGGLDN